MLEYHFQYRTTASQEEEADREMAESRKEIRKAVLGDSAEEEETSE